MGTVKYTGPVASFHCPTNAEIRSLKVHFSPKQEGSGDPSPSNVRSISGWTGVNAIKAGQNLFDPSHMDTFKLSSDNDLHGHYYTQPGSYSIHAYGTGESSYLYAKIKDTDGTLGNTIYIVGDLLKTEGTIVTLTAGQILYVYNAQSMEESRSITKFTDWKMQVVQSNTQPSAYIPYIGTTYSVTFPILGKNKLNSVWESGSINTSTGAASSGSTNIRLKDKIDVIPGEKYTLSWSSTSRDIFRFAYKKDGTFSRYLGLQSVSGQTITFNEDEYYFWIFQYNNINEPENIQFELGNTPTTYEPYNPNHTVYGGWVDLITGEVCETHVVYTGGWIQYNSNLGYKFYELKNILLGDSANKDNISNMINSFDTISSSIGANKIQPVAQGSRYVRAYLELDENYSADTVQYGYRLATPLTYSLAPTQLQTFLGQNNVWSNADYVEVEYDLHETQTLLQRKAFIMANQPHVESASGAIASFKTDLRAPLKECKVHFNPVQGGSGDPSPDNVRPIGGWTGLTAYRTGKNLLDPVWWDNIANNKSYVRHEDGELVYQSNGYKASDFVSVMGNTEYTLHAVMHSQQAGGIAFYNSNKQFISGIQVNNRTKTDHTFTTPSNAVYMRFWDTSAVMPWDEVMLVYGSTAPTTYAPYNGTTIPINWTTEAGTIYGGYVDLVSGEVWQEYEVLTIDDIPFVLGNPDSYNEESGQRFYYTFNTGSSNDFSDDINDVAICNILPTFTPINSSSIAKTINWLSIYKGWGYNTIYGCLSTTLLNNDTTIENIKKFLKDNNFQVYIKRATPQLITTLSPTTLKSLVGANNIWSSAGEVKISYWSH